MAIIGFLAIVGVNVAHVVTMINEVERLFRETSEDSVEGLADEDGDDREDGWAGEGTSASTDVVTVGP